MQSLIQLTMKMILPLFISILLLLNFSSAQAQENKAAISAETEECLMCHSELHPGLVQSWQNGRHAHVSPKQALEKDLLSKRISTEDIERAFLNTAVG